MCQMIRELHTESDLQRCVALLRAAFGTVAAEFGLTPTNAPTNPAFVTFESLVEYLKKAVRLYGIHYEDELVGCVVLERSKTDLDCFYIERLAVHPDHRHRGIGSMLLTFAFEQIVRSGGQMASIGIMDSNRTLKSWYQKKGFTETARKDFAHLPFTVCFMSKSLREVPSRNAEP